ncbi:MAG: D-alanyl-D-alanine carboxypeptidase [Chthonomonas sp.]|nr:D-alanyl-D-alanine carboxypeptidase [Chthonomonas sp.]
MIRPLLGFGLMLCVALSAAQGPVVLGKSAIIIDEISGRVLWAKDANTQRYPASTTKIMTSLLLLESLPLTSTITAPADTERVTGSSLHLRIGEQISAKDALYAMLLRSANDVCHAVAFRISGSDAVFAERMNERAAQIGCKNTTFRNPNGLPDPEHKTTAYDLAMIGREAMKNDIFREVVRTRKAWLSRSVNQDDLLVINRNKWLEKDPTADGIKTGFTDDAGQTYVGSATRNGFRVITVILNTTDWQADHKAMLDWAYSEYGISKKLKKGAPLAELPIGNGASKDVPVALAQNFRIISRKTGEKASIKWMGTAPTAPIRAGDSLGEVEIRAEDGYTIRVPVVAAKDVQRASIFSSFSASNASWYVLGGAMLMGAWVVRRRVRTA